jgi:hypothetical protein
MEYTAAMRGSHELVVVLIGLMSLGGDCKKPKVPGPKETPSAETGTTTTCETTDSGEEWCWEDEAAETPPTQPDPAGNGAH